MEIFAQGQLIFALLSLTVNKLKQLVFEKNSCFCSMEDIKEVGWSTIKLPIKSIG